MAHSNHKDVVERIKAELVAKGEDLSSPNDTKPCNPFKITSRVAWELRDEGVGLIRKGGNNCNGYSTDAIMYKSDGGVYDILVGSGESNTPAWNLVGTRPISDWAPPIKPDDVIVPPPVNDDLAKKIEKLEQLVKNQGDVITTLTTDITSLKNSNKILSDRLDALPAIPTGVTSSARLFGTVKVPVDSKLTYP